MAGKPAPMNRPRRIVSALAPLEIVVLAGCAPEVPAAPTYSKDVSFILDAHCVRCHGANDTLNTDPTIPRMLNTPRICYFQRYEEGGTCPPESTCKHGAGYCAPMLSDRLNRTDDDPARMPPKPADRLTNWEKETLLRWAAVMPPAPSTMVNVRSNFA